ncbi:asparagine synthase C-terminal domain-containing protein [Halobacteriales archaeon Cl-PHB]
MTDLQGADRQTVRDALAAGEPLPGTAGFAGHVDGRLVRDVLGRYPLFSDDDDPGTWSFDPGNLATPDPVPAGHVREADGDRQVWLLPDPDPQTDELLAVDAVTDAIEAAVATVDEDGEGALAVGFSGGVDSGILAATLAAPLYVVGFPDSHDVEVAQEAADLLDRDLTVVELDHDTLKSAVPDVARAIDRTNAMDVSIALPLYLLAQQVAADGIDRLALGQGADELFAGYAKVAKAPDDPRVEAETVRGARREVLWSLPGQFERDVLAVRAGGVEPVTPLVHDRVVRAALALPEALLVTDDGQRKRGLRLAAREWLPEAIAFQDKKAMQYGSLVSRELDRLARQAGFKRRMDDHVTKYVESLVE